MYQSYCKTLEETTTYFPCRLMKAYLVMLAAVSLFEELRSRLKVSVVLNNVSKFFTDRMGQETSFYAQCKSRGFKIKFIY